MLSDNSDYTPVFRYGKCFTVSDLLGVDPIHLIGTGVFLPEGREPVIVLHPVTMKVDVEKVMVKLNEMWTKVRIPETQEQSLAIFPPFFAPDARVVIDSSLAQMERVAWISGNPCFGIELAGVDLRKISSLVGQFVQ